MNKVIKGILKDSLKKKIKPEIFKTNIIFPSFFKHQQLKFLSLLSCTTLLAADVYRTTPSEMQ